MQAQIQGHHLPGQVWKRQEQLQEDGQLRRLRLHSALPDLPALQRRHRGLPTRPQPTGKRLRLGWADLSRQRIVRL
jgi:hypothetical protein